jgi:hypothetical protein
LPDSANVRCLTDWALELRMEKPYPHKISCTAPSASAWDGGGGGEIPSACARPLGGSDGCVCQKTTLTRPDPSSAIECHRVPSSAIRPHQVWSLPIKSHQSAIKQVRQVREIREIRQVREIREIRQVRTAKSMAGSGWGRAEN